MDRNTLDSLKAGPPRTEDELRLYIPYLVNRLTNRWNADQNRDLTKFDINNVVLRTLSILYIYKALTVNQISVLAVAEQSNASRTIDAMVASGWVKREISREDQRQRVVALTKAGEALLMKAWPAMENNYARLVGGISTRDLETCARVLAHMIANIRQNEI